MEWYYNNKVFLFPPVLVDNIISMSDHESDNSEQEGFVPCQLEVKTKNKPHEEREKPPVSSYEAYYLLSTVMIR